MGSGVAAHPAERFSITLIARWIKEAASHSVVRLLRTSLDDEAAAAAVIYELNAVTDLRKENSSEGKKEEKLQAEISRESECSVTRIQTAFKGSLVQEVKKKTYLVLSAQIHCCCRIDILINCLYCDTWLLCWYYDQYLYQLIIIVISILWSIVVRMSIMR